MINYYEILEVDEYSSPEEIKKNYRRLSMKHHPDKGGDPKKFKEVTEAYNYLKDRTPKKVFDKSADAFFKNMFGGKHGPYGKK